MHVVPQVLNWIIEFNFITLCPQDLTKGSDFLLELDGFAYIWHCIDGHEFDLFFENFESFLKFFSLSHLTVLGRKICAFFLGFHLHVLQVCKRSCSVCLFTLWWIRWVPGGRLIVYGALGSVASIIAQCRCAFDAYLIVEFRLFGYQPFVFFSEVLSFLLNIIEIVAEVKARRQINKPIWDKPDPWIGVCYDFQHLHVRAQRLYHKSTSVKLRENEIVRPAFQGFTKPRVLLDRAHSNYNCMLIW